jgi:hypothetical protein
MVKCKACGGVFQSIQADGTQYFHACPPLSAAELAAAVTLASWCSRTARRPMTR